MAGAFRSHVEGQMLGTTLAGSQQTVHLRQRWRRNRWCSDALGIPPIQGRFGAGCPGGRPQADRVDDLVAVALLADQFAATSTRASAPKRPRVSREEAARAVGISVSLAVSAWTASLSLLDGRRLPPPQRSHRSWCPPPRQAAPTPSRFTDFVGSKHRLASARHSGDPAYADLPQHGPARASAPNAPRPSGRQTHATTSRLEKSS